MRVRRSLLALTAFLGVVFGAGALLNDIRKNPGNYYVNVHTTQFGGGAIRGQLF